MDAQHCGQRSGGPPATISPEPNTRSHSASSRTIHIGNPAKTCAVPISSTPAAISQTWEPETRVQTDGSIAIPDESRNRNSDDNGNDGALAGYCYSPLKEHGSIRLLRLMPHENKNSPIRCKLFEYPLEKRGEGSHLYEAISYVWGDSSDQRPIYIQSNGPVRHCLFVTANLHTALLHLRDGHIERTIWADAICIDQKNKAERGMQVQSMAEIYAKAIRVIVWLGEAGYDGDQALKYILSAANQKHAVAAINQREGVTEPDQQLTDSVINETRNQAVFKLLRRPWFERIWVRKS